MRLGWIVLGALVATSACASLLGIESPRLAGDGGVDGALDGDGGGPRDGGDGAIVDGAPADACMSSTALPFTRLLPKVLLAVDRSGSTAGTFTGSTSRLAGIRAAVNGWRTATAARLEVGLVHFPTDNMCAVTAGLRVPMAFNNAAAIDMHLASLNPDGTGPTSAAMTEARDIMKFVTAPAGRHIILVTDGAPNCVGDGEAESVNAVASIPVTGTRAFTIALGTDIQNNYAVALRAAGGSPGIPASIVMTTTELRGALDLVTDEIERGSCAVQLVTTPPAADKLSVRLGANQVPRSPTHSNGWDYGNPTTEPGVVKLYGTACSQFTSGAVLSIGDGCGGLVEGPIADAGPDAATFAPVVTRVSWAPSGGCMTGLLYEFTVATTVSDADTPLSSLAFSGSVPSCTGSISGPSVTITCAGSGGTGSVLVRDPEGNTGSKNFTLPSACTPGMTP